MALYGAGWAFAFDVGVRLYGAEIIAIVGLMIVPWKFVFRKHPMAGRIFVIYSVWVFAIVLADLVNGTRLFDTLRNIATPVLGGLSLLFVIAVASQNPKSLLFFLAATAIAKGVFGEPAYGDKFSDIELSAASLTQYANYFKVRLDPFLTPAILLLSCWIARKNLVASSGLLAIASFGYLVMDARSSGLVFFLSALALVAIHFRFRPKLGQSLVGGVAALALSYVAYIGYVDYTLANNPEGQNGKQLARLENPYDPIALVQQGRSEWLVMTTAIAERPFFGWGSWAIDREHRFAYLRTYRSGSFDYFSIEAATTWGYIPFHSLVGSSWVWSGLLGFFAMAWLLKLLGTMALRLPFIHERYLLPAAVFFTFLIAWHYFFSPPQVARLNFPVSLAALVILTSVRTSATRAVFKSGSS